MLENNYNTPLIDSCLEFIENAPAAMAAGEAEKTKNYGGGFAKEGRREGLSLHISRSIAHAKKENLLPAWLQEWEFSNQLRAWATNNNPVSRADIQTWLAETQQQPVNSVVILPPMVTPQQHQPFPLRLLLYPAAAAGVAWRGFY